MKVFVTAMECEAEAVIRNLTDVNDGQVFGRRVVTGRLDGVATAVVVAGVGKANAAAGTQLAIGTLDADAVINVGVAGGLDPSLSVGAVYRAARAVEYDFDLSKVNGSSVGVPDERDTPFFELAAAGDWPVATVATGDRFTDDERDFAFLRDTFGATVRDMELGAIAHTAFRAGVPVYSFKAITNVVGLGAMTAQYKENLPRCLDVLTRGVPSFFAAI
jgi:adenosylhomocysteine nucleosidase